MNEKNKTMIDLFAGCGGLSLGLERSSGDFTPLLFSEINPSAASTYRLNRQNRTFRPLQKSESYAAGDIIEVGDITKLSNSRLKALVPFWVQAGGSPIDLVCGGPPCQGYSGIGHRRTFDLHKQEIPSNFLFLEMIRVIRAVQPKMFLFENVRGLLSSKWRKDGTPGEIFRDVMSTFLELKNYNVRWDLVHACDYGVPQSRPRVMVVGLHRDFFKQSDPIADATTVITRSAIADGFLPGETAQAPGPEDLLSDLVDPDYRSELVTREYPSEAVTPIQKLLRRLPDRRLLRKGDTLLEQEYSDHEERIIEKFRFMIANGGVIPVAFQTKKFAQKVLPREWGSEGPNITATSMPDDYVHYSQPRILTVREWARLQTFPDWYQFAGPRTTGGRRRAGDPSVGIWEREVPKYTQIGNAVAVLLAKAIGEHFKKNFLK